MSSTLSFFITDGTVPFTVAGAVLVGLMLVEGLGTLILGSGLSHIADALLPEHDADAGADGLADGLLGWLHWGRVPFMAILAMFLAGFTATGWCVQWLFHSTFGAMLPSLLAAAPAVLGGLLFVRRLALPLMKWLPNDHTTAISVDDMGGLIGEVTLAASSLSPGEIRVRDRHGQTHYLRAAPADTHRELAPGEKVVVLQRAGDVFLVGTPERYTVQLDAGMQMLALLAKGERRPAGATRPLNVPAELREKQ